MSRQVRLAIIDRDRCRPKKCNKECKKICPVNSQGRKCIVVDIEEAPVAQVAEALCIGCGMCEKVCPFRAIKIVNIPTELTKDILHRYGENGFRIYKIPIIKKGSVTGLLGENGTGKSTIVRALSGLLIPNFEEFGNVVYEKEVVKRMRGSPMQSYFRDLYAGKLKIAIKHQSMSFYVDLWKQRTVGEILEDLSETVLERYDLTHLLETPFSDLSGGEQQRVSCVRIAHTDADVLIFDEPTNYLDVRQRIKMSDMITAVTTEERYVVVIDHDVSVLEYVSSTICIVYGTPSAYGVFSPVQ